MKKTDTVLNFFLVLSLGLMMGSASVSAASFAEHKGTAPINSDIFADNLLSRFTAIPILDYEMAARYSTEKSFFTLHDSLKFSNIEGKLSDPRLLNASYSFTNDLGQTTTVNESVSSYPNTYSRLEELRSIALSYKPEPEAIKRMRHDSDYNENGTALYLGNADTIRSFSQFPITPFSSGQNSENIKVGYRDGAIRPGIRQILFYNRDGYQKLEAMPMDLFIIDTMRDLRKDREITGVIDPRDPLKIAAWFENKMLKPITNTTVTLPKETVRLEGGEELGRTIARNRLMSLLQETILEAIKTTAYVQIKTAESLQYLGYPKADGFTYNGASLLRSMVGRNVNFVKTDKGHFTFDGPFLYKVTPTKNTSIDTDLNSTLRINFVARDVFTQMLAIYQQVLAVRLKLLTVSTAYNESPTLNEDIQNGKGPVRRIYEDVLEQRQRLDDLTI